MNPQYSQGRFYKSDSIFQSADGVKRAAEVYSYESTTTLYDILVIEGHKFARINGGPPTNLITGWKRAHYEIEHHFGI